MSNKYYTVQMTVVEKSGNKFTNSMLFEAKSRYEAKKRAEDYFEKTYGKARYQVIFGLIRDSSFKL